LCQTDEAAVEDQRWGDIWPIIGISIGFLVSAVFCYCCVRWAIGHDFVHDLRDKYKNWGDDSCDSTVTVVKPAPESSQEDLTSVLPETPPAPPPEEESNEPSNKVAPEESNDIEASQSATLSRSKSRLGKAAIDGETEENRSVMALAGVVWAVLGCVLLYMNIKVLIDVANSTVSFGDASDSVLFSFTIIAFLSYLITTVVCFCLMCWIQCKTGKIKTKAECLIMTATDASVSLMGLLVQFPGIACLTMTCALVYTILRLAAPENFYHHGCDAEGM